MNPLKARKSVYGWIPDLPDKRDFSYAQLAPQIGELPAHIDLRTFCTPLENQGELGCCTACALVGNLEFLKMKKNKEQDFSKLFVYYNERVIEHTTKVDS